MNLHLDNNKLILTDTSLCLNSNPHETLPVMTISLSNLVKNYKTLTSAIPNLIGSVVKGNAYGLGRKALLTPLFEAGCRHFFISDWQEVVDFDPKIVPFCNIYALSGVNSVEQICAAEAGVVPVFHRMDQMLSWEKLFGRSKKCVVQIDTGLNRLGINPAEAHTVNKLDLEIEFVINHLVCGYDLSSETNRQQIDLAMKFSTIVNKPLSIASSCSFILDPHMSLAQSYMVRAGRCIYGIVPSAHKSNPMFQKLSVVANFTVPLISKRYVKKGDNVGYDHKFIAPKDMEVGVLNIGYSSGYCLLRQGQQVFINGQYCEIISQSMDFLMIDITEVSCQLGDRFELFGKNISQDNSARIFLPGEANIIRIAEDSCAA